MCFIYSFSTVYHFRRLRKKVVATFLPPLYQLILRLFIGTFFSNHTLSLFKVVFSCYDRRMAVYGYKPDTSIAVYPTLQRRNAPRENIFKNAAVYLVDRLTENYCHRLKVRSSVNSRKWCNVPNSSVLRPHAQSSVYKSSPHCCGSSKRTFTFTEYLFSSMYSITPVTIMPVKIHSQRLPIRFLFTSVVFIPLKFICYYLVLSFLSIYPACGGTLPAF